MSVTKRASRRVSIVKLEGDPTLLQTTRSVLSPSDLPPQRRGWGAVMADSYRSGTEKAPSCGPNR